MNWAMYLMIALAIVAIVSGSVVYGYALAIKHVRQERERQLIQARLNRINKGEHKAFPDDLFDVFDVD